VLQNGHMNKKRNKPVKRTKKNSKERSQLGTSNNRPQEHNGRELFGLMAGQLEIVGDIESPIEDWKYWNPAKNLEK